ncbi:MAG: ABC transporter permease [Pirellulales bacterium]
MRLQPDQLWGYFEWLLVRGGLLNGFLVALTFAAIGFIVSYLIGLARIGPTEGFYSVAKTIGSLFKVDLPGTSFRRIGAIAYLSFKEAIRRKVLAVVGIFVVGMMFAGWYLDQGAAEPARLYISFVLTVTNYMVLLLGLFISAFSLPAEIKNRTIYTIVTKPVRPTEIFIGRVVGFGAIGTLVLVILGALSFVFVIRSVRHEHIAASVAQDGLSGETSYDAKHEHTFVIGEDGIGVTDEQKGHRHRVVKKGDKVVIEEPQGSLVAKVPVYGTFKFVQANGQDGEGKNVGHESEYQKYIEGNTLESAVWTFEGVTPDRFPNGLRLEMTLAAFRTFKGDIVTGVQGAIIFRNPDGSCETERNQFTVREYQVDQKQFGLKMKGFRGKETAELDLFKDLAPNGKVEVVIRCLDKGQYLGMAPADVFLLAGEAPFVWNFVKGYISIWLQMMIVICFAVMFSTFLTGPVAMIATLACIILGFFGSVAGDILSGKAAGGGPVEALVRISTQAGVLTDLDMGSESVVHAIRLVDGGIIRLLYSVTAALPDFRSLSCAEFVAYGINIFDGLLGRHITITLGYFILTWIIGYFFLKTREMAA